MANDPNADRRRAPPRPGAASGAEATVQRLSATNAGIGVWLILAPFVLGYAEVVALLWNALACGLLLIALGLIRVRAPRTTAWASHTDAGIGVWLVLAPFVLDGDVASARWNDIAVGLLVAALALVSATAGRRL